jgi:hypothetical protein
MFFVANGTGLPSRKASLSEEGRTQMEKLKQKKRTLIEEKLQRGITCVREVSCILTSTGDVIPKSRESAVIIKEDERIEHLVTMCHHDRNSVSPISIWILKRILSLGNPQSDVVVVVGYDDILAVLAEEYFLTLQRQFSPISPINLKKEFKTPPCGKAIAIFGGTNAQGKVTSVKSFWLPDY